MKVCTTMKSVLIVDDDRVILNLLAEGLRNLDYVVATAICGEDAQHLAVTQTFDLAMLDVRMPGMSGLELARLFRAHGGPPFVFLSAFGDEAVVHEAAAAGALGYLVKPVDIRQIVPLIESASARAREIQQLRDAAVHLEKALSSEQKSRTAVGVLMLDKGLDREAAFELLRSQARSQRRRIGELAEELIAAAEAGSRSRRNA